MSHKPICPNCGSNEKVKPITGCRCMSCPPWICMACYPYERASFKGYEFFDDEEEENEEI